MFKLIVLITIFFAYIHMPQQCQMLEQKLGREVVELILASDTALLEDAPLEPARFMAIKKLILNDESYAKVTKLAVFLPNCSLKFNGEVTIQICFSAKQLKVIHREKPLAILDFDPVAEQLSKLILEENHA